ncbi:hypothetical protein K440DRAFT_640083 [Wilcoxina mikolae CBS 423.85]|nr:hypothetical protein K440DRAFT_640083 [Wilcoxina mikolae CBS 423.85]
MAQLRAFHLDLVCTLLASFLMGPCPHISAWVIKTSQSPPLAAAFPLGLISEISKTNLAVDSLEFSPPSLSSRLFASLPVRIQENKRTRRDSGHFWAEVSRNPRKNNFHEQCPSCAPRRTPPLPPPPPPPPPLRSVATLSGH